MPDSSYPPLFSDPSISNALSQINDFAGSGASSTRNVSSPKASPGLSKVAEEFPDGVPVIITGSRAPVSAHFPGLREAMIGSAIFQLAEQLAETHPVKQKIKDLALELHYSGGEIIAGQKVTKPSRRKK